MQIYDGSRDKKVFPTNHTVAIVSANRIASGGRDFMTIRKNGREDWSLFFCETGRLYFEDRVLEANEVWIYPPNQPQRYLQYSKDEGCYRYLHFTGSDVGGMLDTLGIEVLTPIAVGYGMIGKTFDSIQASMMDDSPLSKLMAEYHALYLISLIAKGKKQAVKSNAMKRVTDEMEHAFMEKYDVRRYAALLNVSESRFNHLFKEQFGQAPYHYFLRLRIDNAAALLEDTERKIKEIAELCGFEDPLYFAQVFKRLRGMTPSAYRKSRRG